jgi:hypothetical protein
MTKSGSVESTQLGDGALVGGRRVRPADDADVGTVGRGAAGGGGQRWIEGFEARWQRIDEGDVVTPCSGRDGQVDPDAGPSADVLVLTRV